MTPQFDYALHSFVWTLFGLVMGVIIGRLSRDVHVMAHRRRGTEKPVTEVPKTRRRRPSGRLVLGMLVVGLGLATAVQGLYQDSQTRELAEQTRRTADCTRAYANGFADALDARASASSSAQDALDELMSTVGQLTTGGAAGTPAAREKFRAALEDYLRKRAESKAQQERNPFPPAPRDLCR